MPHIHAIKVRTKHQGMYIIIPNHLDMFRHLPPTSESTNGVTEIHTRGGYMQPLADPGALIFNALENFFVIEKDIKQ
jgi:hypothetical protein